MQIFAPSDEIELIGVGASEREGREWFNGRKVTLLKRNLSQR